MSCTTSSIRVSYPSKGYSQSSVKIKCKEWYATWQLNKWLGLAREACLYTTIPEAIIKSFVSSHCANANGSLLPNTVAGENILYLIQALPELADKLIDVIHKANWDVLEEKEKLSLQLLWVLFQLWYKYISTTYHFVTLLLCLIYYDYLMMRIILLSAREHNCEWRSEEKG